MAGASDRPWLGDDSADAYPDLLTDWPHDQTVGSSCAACSDYAYWMGPRFVGKGASLPQRSRSIEQQRERFWAGFPNRRRAIDAHRRAVHRAKRAFEAASGGPEPTESDG